VTVTDAPAAPAGTAGTAPARRRRDPRGALLGVLGLVVFAGVLELLPRSGLVPEQFFPPFSRMVSALADLAGQSSFWIATWDTVRTWAIGFAIALVAGVGLGLLLGSIEVLRRLTASTVEFLRPVPSVALIPLAVLVFGIRDISSTVLLVVYASFWQVLVQVVYGVHDVDPVARETARSYQLGPAARLRWLVWPTALPYVMTGLRLGAAVALILAVTGELVIGGGIGLGAAIANAQSSGAVPEVYALVIVTGLLGVLVNLGARLLERRVLSWHTSVRADLAG
jgi:ABC-type nitrate/sulfonate/bicarbonate transport system permease component